MEHLGLLRQAVCGPGSDCFGHALAFARLGRVSRSPSGGLGRGAAVRGSSRGFGQLLGWAHSRRARILQLRRARSPGACRVLGTVVALTPNKSFKPTLLRNAA